MAYDFNGSNQRLTDSSPPIPTVPISFACWINNDNIGVVQWAMSYSDSTSESRVGIGVQSSGVAFIATYNTVDGTSANGSTALSNGVWYHICGVTTSATSREIFLNGVSEGTNTTSRVLSGLDRFDVACRADNATPANFWNGRIAELAVWDVALTAAEVEILGKGYSPLFVRPANIIRYHPLVRGLQEVMLGEEAGQVNSPTVADHCRIIYPSSGYFMAQKPVFRHTATSGMTLGGVATTKPGLNQSPTGGLTTSGVASCSPGLNQSPTGGIVIAGVATCSQASLYSHTASGGLNLSGECTTSQASFYVYVCSGGLNLSGECPSTLGNIHSCSGGLNTGGECSASQTSLFVFVASSGVSLGGVATCLPRMLCSPTGGINIAGQCLAEFEAEGGEETIYFVASGGVTIGGASLVLVEKVYRATGSLTLSGVSQTTITVVTDIVCDASLPTGRQAVGESNLECSQGTQAVGSSNFEYVQTIRNARYVASGGMSLN